MNAKNKDLFDPELLIRRKQNRKRDASIMKDVEIGVYYGKDTNGAKLVGRCDVLGVLAIGLDDIEDGSPRKLPPTAIPNCLVAKVGIGKKGNTHAGICTPKTVIDWYSFFEPWDLRKKGHVALLDYASNNRNRRVREAADRIRAELSKTAKQAKLDFKEPEPKVGDFVNALSSVAKEMPDPFEAPAKDLPELRSLWRNGVHYEGTVETLREIFKI